MSLKESAKSFLVRAKNFLVELFKDSTGSSFTAAFLSIYFMYFGVALTVITGNAVVFATIALPAIVGFACLIVEACLAM
jgi:hypothetical protein